MPNFWQKLKKPIFVLAPMADVTDAAFRRMFVRCGKLASTSSQRSGPDVMFTEFVSTDGLCSSGRENLLRELIYHESERPIVAQIWGRNPAYFLEAARLIAKLGFDGIDINLGCPQKKEMTQRTCAALIAEPKLVGKIIAETKRGAGSLSVSVKTRLGIKAIETEKWVGVLLRCNLAAITLHARTVSEMSRVPAHWDEVARAVKLRDKMKSQTLILGNGDVKSLAEAGARVKQTSCDGVMVGRAALGNPWFFAPHKNKRMSGICPSFSEGGHPEMPQITLPERIKAMVEHARLFEKLFGCSKNFSVMRKHFKAYVSGFEGAGALRAQLMRVEDSEGVEDIIWKFFSRRKVL